MNYDKIYQSAYEKELAKYSPEIQEAIRKKDKEEKPKTVQEAKDRIRERERKFKENYKLNKKVEKGLSRRWTLTFFEVIAIIGFLVIFIGNEFIVKEEIYYWTPALFYIGWVCLILSLQLFKTVKIWTNHTAFGKLNPEFLDGKIETINPKVRQICHYIFYLSPIIVHFGIAFLFIISKIFSWVKNKPPFIDNFMLYIGEPLYKNWMTILSWAWIYTAISLILYLICTYSIGRKQA